MLKTSSSFFFFLLHHSIALKVDGAHLYIHDSRISVGDDNVVLGSNHTLVERVAFGSGRGAVVAPPLQPWYAERAQRFFCFFFLGVCDLIGFLLFSLTLCTFT